MARLKSRRPMWSKLPDQDFDVNVQWRKKWSNAIPEVPNKHRVPDPTIALPGFNLPRRKWSILNWYRTGHGLCAETEHKWGLHDNQNRECGQIQSMLHIVEHCPLTKLNGGLETLNTASTEAVAWLGQRHIG